MVYDGIGVTDTAEEMTTGRATTSRHLVGPHHIDQIGRYIGTDGGPIHIRGRHTTHTFHGNILHLHTKKKRDLNFFICQLNSNYW